MFELDEFGFVRLGLKATATFPQINIRSDFQSGIKISDGNWHHIEAQFFATKALLLIDNNVQQVVIYKNDVGKLPLTSLIEPGSRLRVGSDSAEKNFQGCLENLRKGLIFMICFSRFDVLLIC